MSSNLRGVPASPWSLHQRAMKRSFDLLVSSVALIAAVPLLLLIAAAIKLSSPGPVLFKQHRVGRGGRTFLIWKFRTMIPGAASQGPAITAAGDPRVTAVGRWLRRTKLDELPQLVNVWRGDMSFVGPRPELPRYVRGYRSEDLLVLAVRPGITDLASIAYRDEEAVVAQFNDRERGYVEVVLPRKLVLAREYIRGQSFTGDVALVFRTLRAVLRSPEAPAEFASTAPDKAMFNVESASGPSRRA